VPKLMAAIGGFFSITRLLASFPFISKVCIGKVNIG
jgi:hypothetical protein